ncbi:MAG: hypothetical protein ACTS73_01305 [Arsenophonus sp. NEOnobi-MAG3]
MSDLIQDDWEVIAKIRYHPLKNQGRFQAKIIQYITHGNDYFPLQGNIESVSIRTRIEHEAPKM